MQFFTIILIIGIVLFLYRIYHLANDDYVLMKKNVTVENVFNTVFICAGFSLLLSRFFYVSFDPKPVFLNPLGFLLFFYFPGLSLTGAVVGGVLSLYVYSRIKKFPVGRLLDFFCLSFVFVLPLGLMGYFLLSQDITTGGIMKLVFYTIILFTANIYLYPRLSALEIKDGTLSFLFLIFFSLISLLTIAIDNPGYEYFISHRENFILLGILVIGILLTLKQEIAGRIR